MPPVPHHYMNMVAPSHPPQLAQAVPDGFVALALHQSELQMCLLQKIFQKEN